MERTSPSAPAEGASDEATPEEEGPNSGAVLTAALAEYGKLRDEINGRSTTLWTLLGMNATVSSAVAGFVLAQKADPLLLLLLPVLAPSLGLLVIDHATNIGQIGEYINRVLKPLIQEAAGEPRLFCYEEWVDKWETRLVRRTLAFGLPLILLFSVVPVYALIVAGSRVAEDGAVALWVLWAIGVAMTMFQVALWLVFLVPPLRRAMKTP